MTTLFKEMGVGEEMGVGVEVSVVESVLPLSLHCRSRSR